MSCFLGEDLVHLITFQGYILENGQPKLPPGMKQLLQDDLNKGFEL